MSIDPSENPPAQPFRLFVSYAHKNDEDIKDRLLVHLDPSVGSGLIELWEDRAILVGAKWRDEIGKAMDWADGAIFLVSADFLASDFCKNVEVPTFLQRYQEDEHVLLIYVLVNHCDWELKPYIKELQILPPKAKPIRDYRNRDRAYTEITRGIRKYVSSTIARRSHPVQLITSKPEATAFSLSTLLKKLPSATTHLFGRERELEQINDWRDHKGVFLWVADGGTGKSALVRWWLEHQAWPAGTRFLGHSFYRQGSHNQATSSRSFLLDALKQLNVQHETNAADDELGRLLAEAAAASPTVLVLDGIEPLQLASDDEKLNGMVKDRGLSALLEALARKQGRALCLASSRLRIPESSIADAAYFRQRELGLLPPQGALQLLRQRGVRGDESGLSNMAQRCGHHPLVLVLAAEFCHTFLQDSAAEFLQREWQPTPGGKHAATVMAWFDSALAEEHQKLDQELVRILGLFDRPAPWGALQALKEAAPIAGLTLALHEADEEAMFESLARLCQWGLLNADLTQRDPELDAHPLVREYFGALLEKDEPQVWQAAHSVLFDWFCSLPEKVWPDTLEEMEPLFRAVGHGCKAERYLTALKVFQIRLQRQVDNADQYCMSELGGYSSALTTLLNFFPDGWNHQPVTADAGHSGEKLNEIYRSWLLSEVAYCLASLGWLDDALVLARVSNQRKKDLSNWKGFCLTSNNIVELLTCLGRWKEAEAVSREAAGAAKFIDDDYCFFCTIDASAYMGLCLHGQGRLSEAFAAYINAEETLAKNSYFTLKSLKNIHNFFFAKSTLSKLFTIYSYYFAQLLLEQAVNRTDWNKVLARGQTSLRANLLSGHLLSQALDHCTIGLALAALRQNKYAAQELNVAVNTIKKAGKIDFQPCMYLARAGYLRAVGNLFAAWADHDTAHSIAARGNMRTYLAECALLAGNLCLDEFRIPDAAAQYATAAQLIREDGYGRRYAELHLLHARLLHAQHDTTALQVLAEAEARIREVGQWFFWRELCAVAKEIGAPDPGKCPA